MTVFPSPPYRFYPPPHTSGGCPIRRVSVGRRRKAKDPGEGAYVFLQEAFPSAFRELRDALGPPGVSVL